MAKAISETIKDINLSTSLDEIVHTSVQISGVLMRDQCGAKRICSKKDNDSKAIMDAHLEGRASHYS